LKSLYRKNIGDDGFGYLSVGPGWLYLYELGLDDVELLLTTGPVFLVERGAEDAHSHAEVIVYAIAETLTRLGYAASDAGLFTSAATFVDTQVLYQALKARYYDSRLHLKPEFSILNVVDGVLRTVGTIVDSVVEIVGEIVFPGGTKNVPKNRQVNIEFTWLSKNAIEAFGNVDVLTKGVADAALYAFD
jgi:hypothetical protein